MRLTRSALFLAVYALSASCASLPVARARSPLAPADLDAIAQLLMLEDTRRFDEAVLSRLAAAGHPEVRRRAVVSLGRIVDPRGRALLETLRADPDPEIVATVAFSTGQQKDGAAVPWLASLLSSPRTSSAIAREAACALGKIRTPEARVALARYLMGAPATAAAAPVVGEALLAIGRFTTREDLAPITRWASAANVEVRWRAAWALFRPRDPGAVPALLRLADDPVGDVRFWAMRGLAPAVVDPSGIDRARTSTRLRAALSDPDRRVRTEALRTLMLYDDDAAFEAVLGALDSPDTWISVSAAEGLARFKNRAAAAVPRLLNAAGTGKPASLRMTALTALVALAPDAALDVASALTRDAGALARANAAQVLGRLGEAGKARLAALAADPVLRGLLPQSSQGQPQAATRPTAPARSLADYRAIVDRWVVPDYSGAPRPRAVWDTPRGPIELELYPGDAPIAVDYFVRLVDSGDIVGTAFSRVVPNFVAQQRTITGAVTLRDEVNRHGLTRGNLSWASSGLDTGRPGYTLGNTPQPHNEGDFTALGRVVAGMDAVDHLDLGDTITATRMRR